MYTQDKSHKHGTGYEKGPREHASKQHNLPSNVTKGDVGVRDVGPARCGPVMSFLTQWYKRPCIILRAYLLDIPEATNIILFTKILLSNLD